MTTYDDLERLYTGLGDQIDETIRSRRPVPGPLAEARAYIRQTIDMRLLAHPGRLDELDRALDLAAEALGREQIGSGYFDNALTAFREATKVDPPAFESATKAEIANAIEEAALAPQPEGPPDLETPEGLGRRFAEIVRTKIAPGSPVRRISLYAAFHDLLDEHADIAPRGLDDAPAAPPPPPPDFGDAASALANAGADATAALANAGANADALGNAPGRIERLDPEAPDLEPPDAPRGTASAVTHEGEGTDDEHGAVGDDEDEDEDDEETPPPPVDLERNAEV